jgi:hypothetical protein
VAFAAGVFSLYTPGNPVVTGTTITSTWAINTLNDIATGLSSCVLKDGSQTITANIPMSNFKFTGLAAGNAAGNSVRYEQVNLLATLTAKGDIYVATASGVVARQAVGADGTVPMARSAVTNGIAYVAGLNKTIYGLTYANNGTDNLDIAAGGALDATGAYFMVGSALTKQTNVAWAVGNAAGMLDTGVVGNSDYYMWEIARSDTGVVDYLSSLSSTAPTMPASYDFKRLFGWFKRAGGIVVAFTTYETEGGGIELLWNSPTLDINLANTLTTSRRTDAVKVPLNFSVVSFLNVVITDVLASNTWIYCPDQTDLAPSTTATPLANIAAAAGASTTFDMKIRTSSAGLIAARSSVATIDLYAVSTMGFNWARRN